MKRSFIYLFILMLLCTAGTAFAQGEIYGKITDEKGGEFPGVVVKVLQGGLLKAGSISEDDGSYSVKPLQPGTYDVEFSSSSYNNIKITGLTVSLSGSTVQNVKMRLAGDGAGRTLGEVVIRATPPPVSKVKVATEEEINRSATQNLVTLAATSVNVQQTRNGAGLRIGGARIENTRYVVDGVMVSVASGGITPAQNTVGQLQVFSSGIPANLGDATGGVVSITSKGISSKLKGSVQGQHSIDGYNQNLVNASFTGPLISRKLEGGAKQPILGFLAGVDYQFDKDSDPTFTRNPILKSEVLKSLQDNPLTLVNGQNGTNLVSSTTKVTKDDFYTQKRSINNETKVFRFNGKLDYAVNSNINLTAGGNFAYSNSQNYSRAASYFAPESIPSQIDYTGRGYIRFKQSFANNTKADSGRSTPVISNAYYTVQLDYQMQNAGTESSKFKRNLFDYAYVGKFKQNLMPLYTFAEDSLTGRKAVVLQTYDFATGIEFQASDKNPILANYTKNVYQNASALGPLTDLTSIQGYLGLMNGDVPRSALQVQAVGINNVGAGMTSYNYNNNNQLGLHADASFDFKPGKRKGATVHAIQFGLYYEQRSGGAYNASINNGATATSSLWNVMRDRANINFNGLDYTNPIFIHNGERYTRAQVEAGTFFLPTDTIIYDRRLNSTPSKFSTSIRQALGAGQYDYVDIHNVDPSKLSLGMFSADELLGATPSQGFVSYYGYDYTGNKLKGQVNFNDFFTQKEGGYYTRPIGAWTPNYIAGYVMDAFRFEKMKFNVGVRIERYDNNTKVLKDPYSLYELNTKSGVDGSRNIDNGGKHPTNIGDNYAVYVNNNLSATPTIIGYRNADKWYNSFGVEIPDPTVLKEKTGGSNPQPFLTTAGKVEIDNERFDPNNSFTDYKPKVTASPRFQFEFPINEDLYGNPIALFYAHYDILVQRPTIGNFASPLDYWYMPNNSSSSIIGNPNLQPEKTFDYELGFQQTITPTSGIGISAFYRERKDMIQVRPYLYSYPLTYYTYGNRDFTTTKGFTFTYDYRKPRGSKIPVEMSVAYTLQFADGTGSNAASSNGGNGNQFSTTGLLQNFISSGLPNLRYVSPLNYDSRHNINLTFNFNYDKGEGPTAGSVHFLENFNANMILRARSGEPYTTIQNVVGNAIQGGLNGTRLNWHFGADMKLEKRFTLGGGKKSATDAQVSSSAPRYYISAFLYFQNLFNIKDVLGVYPYTSRPDDDGYIASPIGQQTAIGSANTQNFQDLYSLYVNNPGFYNSPRRATLGFSFSF